MAQWSRFLENRVCGKHQPRIDTKRRGRHKVSPIFFLEDMEQPMKSFLIVASVFGLLAVILGAFGAHALKDPTS